MATTVIRRLGMRGIAPLLGSAVSSSLDELKRECPTNEELLFASEVTRVVHKTTANASLHVAQNVIKREDVRNALAEELEQYFNRQKVQEPGFFIQQEGAQLELYTIPELDNEDSCWREEGLQDEDEPGKGRVQEVEESHTPVHDAKDASGTSPAAAEAPSSESAPSSKVPEPEKVGVFARIIVWLKGLFNWGDEEAVPEPSPRAASAQSTPRPDAKHMDNVMKGVLALAATMIAVIALRRASPGLIKVLVRAFKA